VPAPLAVPAKVEAQQWMQCAVHIRLQVLSQPPLPRTPHKPPNFPPRVLQVRCRLEPILSPHCLRASYYQGQD